MGGRQNAFEMHFELMSNNFNRTGTWLMNDMFDLELSFDSGLEFNFYSIAPYDVVVQHSIPVAIPMHDPFGSKR